MENKIKNKKKLKPASNNKKKINIENFSVLSDSNPVDLSVLENLEQVKEDTNTSKKIKAIAKEKEKNIKKENSNGVDADLEEVNSKNNKTKQDKDVVLDVHDRLWKVLFFITLGISGVFLIALIILIIILNTPPTNLF